MSLPQIRAYLVEHGDQPQGESYEEICRKVAAHRARKAAKV